MSNPPFERLVPASNSDHAQWAVTAMAGREGVALVIPDRFDAYVRLLHPLGDGQRWEAVGPDYLQTGAEAYRYPFPEAVAGVEGDMGTALLDTLVPVLAAATSTPQHCHYALWSGWGDLHPASHTTIYSVRSSRSALDMLRARRQTRLLQRRQERAEAPVYEFVESCAIQQWWGGRDLLLFDGPLDASVNIGAASPFADRLSRRSPQWWWPEDRSWFVATEIGYPWTYLAGTTRVIDAIMSDRALDAVRVRSNDCW